MSNENAPATSNFELFLKTPNGIEAAIRVSAADIPPQQVGENTVEGVAAMAVYMTRLDQQLATAKFTRSERLDKPARGGGGGWQKPAAPTTVDPETGEKVEVKCPVCSGAVWDNRPKKATGEFKSSSPDFRCKDKNCEGVIWPAKQ